MRAIVWLDAHLIAPDASRPERLLGYGAALLGAATVAVITRTAGLPLLSIVVCTVVAFDIFGGATSNALPAAKRWWHRPGQTARHKLVFVAGHVQPFVLALTVPGFGWTLATGIYCYTLLSAGLMMAVSPGLRLAAGFTLTGLGITVSLFLAPAPPELAWFGPLLLIKLLLAHVPEGFTSRP